jgi:hypothetical protein
MDALREIPGPVGTLEARLDLPAAAPRAVAVIAHPHPPYGGTLQTRAVHETAKALSRVGVAALRFNFRGVGISAGAFDGGRGEQDDYRAALDYAAARFPGVPLWAVGMSFGAWVATTVGAADPRVTALLAVAPAVGHYDFDGLKTAGKPAFVIHGEEDELAPIRQVRRLYGEMAEPKELVVIEGADHVFDGRTSMVGEAIEDLLGDFEKETTTDTKGTKDDTKRA